VGEREGAPTDLGLVTCDVDHEILDLEDLLRAEGRGLPVELAEARVELGRDQREQDEVVEPRGKVERREARQRQGEEHGSVGEDAPTAKLLDRALRADEIVSCLHHHHIGRGPEQGLLVETAEVEPPKYGRTPEVCQDGRYRVSFSDGQLWLGADDHRAHR
jgi:hypothetical protein